MRKLNHYAKIDLVITTCLILVEILAICRMWIIWDDHTLWAIIVWSAVSIFIVGLIWLQVDKILYYNKHGEK